MDIRTRGIPALAPCKQFSLHIQANADAVQAADGVVQAGIDAHGRVRRRVGDRRRINIGDIVDLAEDLPMLVQVIGAADIEVKGAGNEVVVDRGIVDGRQRAPGRALNVLGVEAAVADPILAERNAPLVGAVGLGLIELPVGDGTAVFAGGSTLVRLSILPKTCQFSSTL